MDPYSSGENFNIKTRKPYTITKQRERWTEEEHNSFLEALKLYGRAWQRIEEHIGTKTAVQIRSHAQKFFTKLEKEALAKGVPISQALDMDIPPPRPKRKPNYPYPRKTGPNNHLHVTEKDVKQTTLQSGIQILDLERNPLPEYHTTGHEEKLEDGKTNGEMENDTEGRLLSQEVEAVNPGVFREFISASEKVKNHDETNESYITIVTRKHLKSDQDGIKHTNITSSTLLFETPHENITDKDLNPPGNFGNDDIRNYPRHVPVQIVDGNPPEISFQESTLDNNASRSSDYQTFPTFHPLYPGQICDNKENYRSFLHVSSTISSLIVSSLLQNPVAHAAASFAATFWHHPAYTEASSGDSSSRNIPPVQLNSETPAMAAIATATVAAATAWWATHGMLPGCTPFYPFSFGTPIDENGREKAHSEGIEKMDAETTPPDLPKESADLSSSEDSDERGDKKSNPEISPDDTKEMGPVEAHDSNVRKQVDRSSCGSNTTSSSEIETDALEKHEKEKEEMKGLDVNLPSNDSNSRRSRSTISPNESWKEVSEEGRLAFQALFSRQVLPQSFSKKDLNLITLTHPLIQSDMKLNVHHTGFKPYKRCSVEAKETKIVSGGSQNDDKCPKRLRLEAD